MRTIEKYYKNYDRVRVSTFLLFPKTINGERRWLERAEIVMELVCCSMGSCWSEVAWGDQYDGPIATPKKMDEHNAAKVAQ